MTSQLLIGLPKAGKSTFLAALWHVTESEEADAGLRVKELRGNWQHLQGLRTQWSNCLPLERTIVAGDAVVSMVLEDKTTGEFTEVSFPDLSGESFELQWTTRKCPAAYRELASASEGIILCIHPNVRKPLSISEVDAVAEDLIAELEASTSPTNDVRQSSSQASVAQVSNAQAGKEWKAEYASTQVQLVELLQLLTRPPLNCPARKLAVIMSAWDLVRGQKLSPADWLARELPLLDQFLRANPELWQWKVYGVSAQGGDLEKDAERLLRIRRAAERIQVEAEGVPVHDITAPVKWLMSR